MKSTYSKYVTVFIVTLSTIVFSCKKFIAIDPPRTDLVAQTVFTSDNTANAAMADVYLRLSAGFAGGSTFGISFLGSISSDEMINYQMSSGQYHQQFNVNTLTADNTVLSLLWSQIFEIIYKTNSILEGLSSSTQISLNLKNQLTGEAKFVRAFCHFYLVNFWGDAPLVLSTDYRANNVISRTDKAEVYKQIIADLKDAQNLLPDNYSSYKNERVRASKGAATALLSRAYLYTQDWVNAETEASSIISNTSLYTLEPNLSLVFRATGKEPIFQLWFSNFPTDRNTFFISSAGPRNGAFRSQFVSDFESGDQRWAKWGQTRVVQGVTYYGALKYLDFTVPPLDYSTVMRLAEQYLIRAEARAKQGKITGVNSAESDINIIRNRAGLGNTTANMSATILLAIEQERRSEFFTEWGHRWFDLKRTGRAAAILGPIKTNWQAYKEFFPIPEAELINNPNLIQNTGY